MPERGLYLRVQGSRTSEFQFQFQFQLQSVSKSRSRSPTAAIPKAVASCFYLSQDGLYFEARPLRKAAPERPASPAPKNPLAAGILRPVHRARINRGGRPLPKSNRRSGRQLARAVMKTEPGAKEYSLHQHWAAGLLRYEMERWPAPGCRPPPEYAPTEGTRRAGRLHSQTFPARQRGGRAPVATQPVRRDCAEANASRSRSCENPRRISAPAQGAQLKNFALRPAVSGRQHVDLIQ